MTDRNSNVLGFTGVNANYDLFHICALTEMVRAPIEEDRTVKVRTVRLLLGHIPSAAGAA
ncbi:MAG: hypothetical protein ACJA1F_003273 [Paracoccaceae bacterium]|jgi:hypothetical protein